MAVKLFLLGRPGSGKSTAARHIEKAVQAEGWSTTRYNDYTILQEMFRFERLFQVNEAKKSFRSTEHGGFDIIKFDVLDTALTKLEKEVNHSFSSIEKMLLIEFARDDYTKALDLFTTRFLKNAYFIYIDVSANTCIERVHKRVAHRTFADDHFVSDDIIRSYYSQQRLPSFFSFDNDNPHRLPSFFRKHSSGPLSPSKAEQVVDKKRAWVVHNMRFEEEFYEALDQCVSTIFSLEGFEPEKLPKGVQPKKAGILERLHLDISRRKEPVPAR